MFFLKSEKKNLSDRSGCFLKVCTEIQKAFTIVTLSCVICRNHLHEFESTIQREANVAQLLPGRLFMVLLFSEPNKRSILQDEQTRTDSEQFRGLSSPAKSFLLWCSSQTFCVHVGQFWQQHAHIYTRIPYFRVESLISRYIRPQGLAQIPGQNMGTWSCPCV